MEYLVVAGIAFAVGFFLAYKDTSSRKREIKAQEASAQANHKKRQLELDKQLNDSVDKLTAERDSFDLSKIAWQQEFQRLLNEARDFNNSLETGFLEGRNWLANAYSEYIQTRDLEHECALVLKPNPAWKAAETLSAIRAKRVEMARELKLLQYQLASYEEYFPVLVEYRDAILDEVIDLRGDADAALEEIDPALGFGYLSKEEYDRLDSSSKFQLALDRYWRRNKSNVEIGRLYERFVGYYYESKGWKVNYVGALKGFEDFGRDLICERNERTEIVQCKCWSQDKVIREKHIMQLFGTSVLYRITNQQPQTKPVFIASTSLSDEASMVARELSIKVHRVKLERYPMVKCNVNPNSGEKIYHLPFDQQYDRVIIGDQPGEFYAETVAEAEAAGFRRAYRWRGAIEGAFA